RLAPSPAPPPTESPVQSPIKPRIRPRWLWATGTVMVVASACVLIFSVVRPAILSSVSSGPRITTFAGTGHEAVSQDGSKAGATDLATVDGIAVNQNGDVYVADALRIRVVHDGFVSTVAGNSSNNPGFSGDGGPALQAQLSLSGAGGFAFNRGTVGVVLDLAGHLL